MASDDTKGEMRYCWEFHPNAEMATLHVGFRVPKGDAGRDSMRFGSESRPGDAGAEKVMEIDGIEGVTFACLGAYGISVEKGRLFPWEELCPKVIEVVRSYFGFTTAVESPARPEPLHYRDELRRAMNDSSWGG